MQWLASPKLVIPAGALACAVLALLVAQNAGPRLAGRLTEASEAAIAEEGAPGIRALFVSPSGWASRHPLLVGGENYSDAIRANVARAVARQPGVAGIRWADGSGFARQEEEVLSPLHCQDDVQALLRARTIRFEEASARIDAASQELVDEVANALAPCLGSIIAVTGHTDASGPEPGNLELSRERADAVRRALIERGIPSDGLRALGVGSAEPVEGLDPADPANRRIEFSVIATVPIKPTPVDTPAPR
jgi:OOP family OmpA-OmpF porin